MSEQKLIELLTEQVELSKQILAELQKQSAHTTMHEAEHLLTDKVIKQDGKDINVPTMRPIEDWLNELPEPIRSKALASVDKESELYESVDGCAGTCYNAIHYRNDADQRTKEGVDYWVNIYEQLEAGAQPIELVDPVHLDKSRQ